MDESRDFLKFKKGEFKAKSLEELLGKPPEKQTKNEYELIEEGLNLRRKMAELCKAIARRLEKHAEARDLRALEAQIEELNEMFSQLKEMEIPL
ncbi:MAG TPA: hypothetical protein V6D00_04330 [Pantanalinema sp.]